MALQSQRTRYIHAIVTKPTFHAFSGVGYTSVANSRQMLRTNLLAVTGGLEGKAERRDCAPPMEASIKREVVAVDRCYLILNFIR